MRRRESVNGCGDERMLHRLVPHVRSILPRPRNLGQCARMTMILKDARLLREGGGLRFSAIVNGVQRDAFVVRFRGELFAYVNTCRHQSLALDFGDARFFDEAFDAIVCCQHGARYRPETGECFAGPCLGARLTPLAVAVRDGAIWWVPPGRSP